MLKLYGCPNTRSFRALWALEEARAPYEYVKVDLLKGEGRKPSFLEINPGGKVPAVIDGDLVLTESGAIVTYVGERYPASGLVPPAGSRERALYDRWCFFAIAELEQPLWSMAKHRFVLPEQFRLQGMNETGSWEFAQQAKVLDAGLGDKPYILGERFTGADILIGHTLAWAKRGKQRLDSDRLDAYFDRLLTREAVVRARAVEARG